MIYIPSSFHHGNSNQLPQYATKGDGVRSYHLQVFCVVDIIEACPKALIFHHFEETKKNKSRNLACPTKRCGIHHKVEKGNKIL
jgi:hypothetical protein